MISTVQSHANNKQVLLRQHKHRLKANLNFLMLIVLNEIRDHPNEHHPVE